MIPYLVGNPYKPLFVTVTGQGDNPIYIYISYLYISMPSRCFIDYLWNNCSLPSNPEPPGSFFRGLNSQVWWPVGLAPVSSLQLLDITFDGHNRIIVEIT